MTPEIRSIVEALAENQAEIIADCAKLISEMSKLREENEALKNKVSELQADHFEGKGDGKRIYLINHVYDVDGGFGDAVSCEDTMFATENKDLAEQYVKKYSNPEIYDSPYSDLYRHELIIKEYDLEEPDLERNPWEEVDESGYPVYYP